jgi:hypothetical protein
MGFGSGTEDEVGVGGSVGAEVSVTSDVGVGSVG